MSTPPQGRSVVAYWDEITHLPTDALDTLTRPTWAETQAWHHNRHECPGLFFCRSHPKWNIVKVNSAWSVYTPHARAYDATYPTWAEAYEHANQQARDETDRHAFSKAARTRSAQVVRTRIAKEGPTP